MNGLLRMLLDLPPEGSTLAAQVDRFHFLIIGTTMVGSTVVGVVALWFALRYRRRSDEQLTPRVVAPVWLELVVIFSLLGMFLAFWVVGFGQYLRLQAPPDDALEVYVTAKQWMWKFAYPGGPSTISSLVVPVGRPVKLIMTSRDVIHSFYVPAFRQKKDVLPGRYTVTWFEARQPGRYEILCAEYCGTSHSQMSGEVLALDPPAYERWLEGLQAQSQTVSMAERGRDAAMRHGCFSCHTLDGQKHIGPSWRGLFGREEELQDGRRVLADEAYLTRSMMDPAAEVVAGFAPVMPTYQGLLQPGEVGAIVELIRSVRAPLPPPDTAYPVLWKDRAP
jgi:cytochrome c oxidase subunit 2